MTITTYTCNLCDEERDPADLYAVYNTARLVHSGDSAAKVIAFDFIQHLQPRWNETHRHICKECVRHIKEKCK